MGFLNSNRYHLHHPWKATDWMGFLEQNPGGIGEEKRKQKVIFITNINMLSSKGLIGGFTGADI